MTLRSEATIRRDAGHPTPHPNPLPKGKRALSSPPPLFGGDREEGVTPPAAAQRRVDHGAPENAWDAAYVIARLEEAGRTLLAMPHTGPSPRMRTSVLDVVRSAVEGYGWGEGRLRPASPDSAHVTRMDEALGWISRIPVDRYVLRRIVGARALINPTTDRHVYPWRRLGATLGADHKAVQRWHAQGILLILASLNGT
jgi:hypothetical protein